jgi:DNA-binding NarL/FixJ family response regulator
MPSRRGRAVVSEAQYHVVILYEHPLLGEGIAKYLRTRAGVEATVVSAYDGAAVMSALALDPAVVIFELNDPIQQMGLNALAPHAVLIDVSTVITRGFSGSSCVAGLEQILQAVGGCSAVARPA